MLENEYFTKTGKPKKIKQPPFTPEILKFIQQFNPADICKSERENSYMLRLGSGQKELEKLLTKNKRNHQLVSNDNLSSSSIIDLPLKKRKQRSSHINNSIPNSINNSINNSIPNSIDNSISNSIISNFIISNSIISNSIIPNYP